MDERYGVAATDLRGYKVRGFLDKKRPSKKLLSVKYQRRWCVLHDSTLYYFEDPRDRRQKGAFSLIGYRFWHGGGADNAFSLVARGKRTYDFICPTIEDFERWKEGILSVTENVPSGHEVFVNKTSVGGGSMGRSSPSTQKKIVRQPSFSSDDSADNADVTPVRPTPVSRPPRRPPMPPVPRTEKTPVTKKQSEPLDMYSTVNKQQLSRTNTAIPVPSNKPSGWDDDLDDYDVVDHRHPKQGNKGSGSEDEIYDRPDVGPEPVYATAKHHGIRSDSSSDSDDYSHVSPRTSDYFTPSEIEELRKRTSSGYDKPYELESLRKQSPPSSSDADEPSYLSSAELHGSQRNDSPANKNFDSNIALLLGLKLKDQRTDTRNANVEKNNAKRNRKSRKKHHQEEPGLNSVPEDPYMEFVGEGGMLEDSEDQEDLQSGEVQKYSDPDDPYMEFVGEEALGEQEEEEDQDILQSQEVNNVSHAENMNEIVQKKPLSHLHSLQLELNSKLVKRLQGGEKEETAPREPKPAGDDGEEEPLYENFLNINSLETRSLPRDIKMPSTPPLPSHKRKQSSFESNTDSSSDGEFPPPPHFCPVSK